MKRNARNSNRAPIVAAGRGQRLRRGVALALPVALAWGVAAQAADASGQSTGYSNDNESTSPSATYPPDNRPIILGEPDTDQDQSPAHLAAPQPTSSAGQRAENGGHSAAATRGSSASSNTASQADDQTLPGAYDEIPVNASGVSPGIGASDIGDTPTLGFNGSAYGGCGAAIGGPSDVGISRDPSVSVLQRPSAPARAQQRYLRASVSGSETYSDNINLAPSGQARSDFVTSVSPRIDGCSTQGRIRGSFSYQLQGVVYANESQYNDVYNDFEGETTADVIKNHLYIDANTSYGQQVIDPSFGYADSNIIRPNQNKTTSWLTNISPYLVQSLGPLGHGQLRYRYGRSVYDGDVVPDTSVQSVFASIVSPDTALPVSWQAQAVTQRVETGNSDTYRFPDALTHAFPGLQAQADALNADRVNHFDSASLQLGYALSPAIKVTTTGGVEDRYHEDGRNDRWSAPFWETGIDYENAANTLDLSYGHHFYGYDFGLNASHRVNNLRFDLSYKQDLSTPGLESLDNNTDGSTFGSIGSISGQLGPGFGRGFGTDGSLLNRGVYVHKRWNASMHFQTALTDSDISAFWDEQSSVSNDEPSTHYHGIELDSRYALRPRVSVVPSFSWTRYDGGVFDTGASNSYQTNVSIVRAVTRTLNAAVGYGRSWRDGGGGEYTENRVTLQIQKSF